MTKFLNKKERVYDLKLTPYGHYLLSIGTFKPVYYSFLDDNVLYDGAYAGLTESQNDIHKRIKQDTSYLESFVIFRDIESGSYPSPGPINYYEVDVTPTLVTPAQDVFHFNSVIGDAYLDADAQLAPAWKVIPLNGRISTSTLVDDKNSERLPQINMTLNYTLTTEDASFNPNPNDIRDIIDVVDGIFADEKIIVFEADDALLYVDEKNTQILTENFDLEVFEILTGSGTNEKDTLQRKYFKTIIPQIEDGFMVSPVQKTVSLGDLSTGSVEYYFDVVTDAAVNEVLACRGADRFNKESYYIDIDFDCSETADPAIFTDIYGRATEPEICQS
tara:strand:- start:1206 stop:2201 length:996 start_codon:yes stop_codon:yes gene_type:complete